MSERRRAFNEVLRLLGAALVVAVIIAVGVAVTLS